MVTPPFPGMDPWLEAPEFWPDVHHSLMTIFRDMLVPALLPKYVAEIQTQIVVERAEGGRASPIGYSPDISIHRAPTRLAEQSATAVLVEPVRPLQRTLPISVPFEQITVRVLRRSDLKLVTAIELLSPANKRPGKGWRDYLRKRDAYAKAGVHLVEIDLLRKGLRMPLDGDPIPTCAYLAVVTNADRFPNCGVWPIALRAPLPELPIPLLPPDPAVPLNIQLALATAYDRARYDLRVDYSKPPEFPLTPDDWEWSRTLVAASPTTALE